MRNIHNILRLLFVLITLLMGSFFMASAQVIKEPFKARKTFKQLQGDFLIIGNSNMGTHNGSTDNKRTAFLKLTDFYVFGPHDDISSVTRRGFSTLKPHWERNITNSSSATLAYPAEIASLKSCTHIVYAGLYWYGRGDLPNKDRIKFKHPNIANIRVNSDDLVADEVIEPTNADGMYLAYKDVTNQISTRTLQPGGTSIAEGRYAVGNIASLIDANPEQGNFAGWYMVLVYNTPGISVKDISVYDGMGFVNPKLGSQEADILINDFTSVKEGIVNAKLSFLAVEGDANEQGDYLKMKNNLTGDWEELIHAQNTSNNFFNSSIVTPSGSREPNMTNNFGVDIAEFKLPNSGNQYIQNAQSGTQFRFGSTSDSFALLNLVLAVESDPDVGAEIRRFKKVAPATLEVCQNHDAVFESTATTNDVIWEYWLPSINGGGRWESLDLLKGRNIVNITGRSTLEQDGSKLKFVRASQSWNGLLVRSKLRVGYTPATGNSAPIPCEIISNPTRIVIVDQKVFTRNLSDITICPGASTGLSVEVNGGTLVWQYFDDHLMKWEDIGAEGYGDLLSSSGPTLNIAGADLSLNGLKVRAKILASGGCSEVLSNESTITVRDLDLFVINLPTVMSICRNGKGTITLSTINNTPVIWQYFDVNDSRWNSMNSYTGNHFDISGATLAISRADEALNDMKVRAITTDIHGCSSVSEEMKIALIVCGTLVNPILPSRA